MRHPHLHDLERFGIVKIQPVGRAYQLELNRKSYVLCRIIEPMVKYEKNTFVELVTLLKKYLDTSKISSAARPPDGSSRQI